MYRWFNCLEIGPCAGWMTSNSTLRQITSKHARRLNGVLKTIAEKHKFDKFDIHYVENPFQAVLADCWSGVSFAGADAGIVSDAKLERLNLFVQRAYSVMFEHNVKLDPVYPTRSSPLN